MEDKDFLDNVPEWENFKPEPTAEIRRIKRSIRRQNILLVVTSLLLVAAVITVAVLCLTPTFKEQQDTAIENKIEEQQESLAVEEATYWDPNESRFSKSLTDLELTLHAYTELFFPHEYLSFAIPTKTDFATYSLSIFRYDKNGDRQYYTGTLSENELTLSYDYLYTDLSINQFLRPALYEDNRETVESGKQRNQEKLRELPDYIEVQAAVSFKEAMTMEELLAFADSVDGYITWSVISTPEDMPHVGIDVLSTRFIYEGINTSYPMFCIDSKELAAEDLEQHFISLLEYSWDRVAEGKGIVYEDGHGESIFGEILEYVEENGVTCYGCMIVASPEFLAELAGSELVSQFRIIDGWLDF